MPTPTLPVRAALALLLALATLSTLQAQGGGGGGAGGGGTTRPTTPTAPVTGGGGTAIAPGTLPANIGNLIGAGGVNLGNLAGLIGNLGASGIDLASLIGGLGAAASNPIIVASSGVLTGDSAQASVIIPSQISAGGANGGTQTAAAGTTYQWTISGGRITSSPTAQTITYVADSAGTVTLNVTITSNGTSASTTVTAISPDMAGSITAPATVATNATNLTASVPPAVSGDRTFAWTVSGDAAITAGQRTNSITLRPGTAGLKTITCSVTLQRLVTVDVKSFLVVTGNGPSVAVTVNGGSAALNGSSGTAWPAGSKVDIFANPPPAGQVFDKWTGDTSAFTPANASPTNAALLAQIAHQIVTVPSTPITLTATYKPAPAWTPATVNGFNLQTQTNAQGQTNTVTTTLAYYIPAGAQGLVFLLHDTGGTAGEWFTRPEQLLLTRDLVAAGYGVAALDSVNRNSRTWSAQTVLANNLDALNHLAALNKFAADGLLAATKPVFFLGMTDGGDTGVRFADLLLAATPARPVKGAVLYCAASSEALAVTSKVPQFFALAANDGNLGTAGNTTARTNSQLLAGRGLATAVTNNAASPVLPGRFLALGVNSTGFAASDAQAIHAALKTANLLDDNNYLKALPAADALRTALPAAYQTRTADVAAQLAVAFAGQQFFSDADARVINFLNGRVAGTPAPAPGRLVNLSTRTIISAVGDTFALGFNISANPGTNDRATLLIRGVGPALKAFGLDSALPAPHLEVNSGTTVIARNDGWDKPATGGATAAQISAAAASVGAFALPAGSGDTALLLQLAPGAYTVNLSGTNGVTGDVLAEVYDVSKNNTRLTNLSTLAKINNEGDLLIPGIVVAPASPGNTTPRTLMVRAVGPGLGVFGLGANDLLGDPRITVLQGTATVATNNNWSQGGASGQQGALTAAFPAVGAFPLKAADADAALVSALAPAAYTLQAGAAPVPNVPANLQGTVTAAAPNPTGKVLVEVYEVP